MEDLSIIQERNLDGTAFTPSFFSADLKDLQGFGSPEPGSGKRCFCLCGGQYLCCEGINRNLTSFQDEKMIEDVTSSTEATPTAEKPAKIDKCVQTESDEKFTLKTKNQRPLSINHNMQPNQMEIYGEHAIPYSHVGVIYIGSSSDEEDDDMKEIGMKEDGGDVDQTSPPE